MMPSVLAMSYSLENLLLPCSLEDLVVSKS